MMREETGISTVQQVVGWAGKMIRKTLTCFNPLAATTMGEVLHVIHGENRLWSRVTSHTMDNVPSAGNRSFIEPLTHHTKMKTLSLLLCATCVQVVFAGDSPKQVHAVRVARAPTIDGFLNDEQWTLARPATDFTQRDPDEGKPASEQTEIRVLYDDANLYFGCMFLDSEPEKIVARLTRRDNEIESDWGSIRLDAFHDHQNCYEFTFNAAGVKVDILQYEDGNREDDSWDVVWDVQTQLLPNGWSAEVRIPLSVLRYRSDIEEWGVTFVRTISRKHERAEWVHRPKSQSGFVSRFGHLVGLHNVPAPHRVELLPFIVSKQDWRPEKPTVQRVDKFSGDAGLDFKYALSNNFLLDATVNPDFGQVEADPAVLNLSTFETFYPEKRPFFIEGTQIIRFTTFGDEFGPGMFYSRRIGRGLSPDEVSVLPKGRILDVPLATTILGAAKLSGKTNSGTSLGALQAFTKEMRATVADSNGTTAEQIIEPFSHYNVLRVRQDVLDNSLVGLILTSTAKEKRLPALTAGADWNLKFDTSTYQLDGFLSLTHADNLLDGRRSRGLGAAGVVNFSRIAAEHWLWSLSIDFTSKGFNINDVGFFRRPNDWGGVAFCTYKEDAPAEVVRSYRITLFLHERENFDKANLIREASLSSTIIFTNYWELNVSLSADVGKFDDRETRGNGLYARPSVVKLNIGVETDARKDVAATQKLHAGWDSRRKFEWGALADLLVRPTSWMEFELIAGFNRVRNQEAWVENRQVTSAMFPAGRILSVFADRTTDEVSFTLRNNITFTRELTLQLYAQVFLAKGHYENFRGLLGTSEFLGLPTPVINPDFNSQALNTNLVLRWEYVPGSTLFFVWSQARNGNNGNYFSSFGSDFGTTFRTPPANVLLLKVSYWWNL
jgi:hypothetical protein